MGVIIKKKDIKWIIVGVIIAIALFFGISSSIKKSIEKERAEREYDEYLDRSIKREYKDLIREYEMYKESFEESDYYSTQSMYKEKINKLVGESVLNYSHTNIPYTLDEYIREKLRDVAKSNVYKELYSD